MAGFFASLKGDDAAWIKHAILTCTLSGSHDGIEALAATYPHLLHCKVNGRSGECRITLAQAFEKNYWAELDETQQGAAATLGYDPSRWEQGLQTDVCAFSWYELTATEQMAATLLGYCDETWNEELDGTLAASSSAAYVEPTAARIQGAGNESSELEADPDVGSSSSAGLNSSTSQLSCKEKADKVRGELGLSAELPMPSVVQQGFEIVGTSPPPGGVVVQVQARCTRCFLSESLWLCLWVERRCSSRNVPGPLCLPCVCRSVVDDVRKGV